MIDADSVAGIVEEVLSAVWTGSYPDPENAQEWVIDKLRDAMSALGVDWVPPAPPRKEK